MGVHAEPKVLGESWQRLGVVAYPYRQSARLIDERNYDSYQGEDRQTY